ncbi:MAG: flagellar hook-basal body complex protein FliE [Bacteriovoracaceae bacterium]|jgi:flagellar hook-basal body complex protein FliE|nr:flagellar hook-basal body complex protein FliE [Bacteriovoracaceae bacterium]
MSIQTIGGIHDVLNKYDAKAWTKSAELGVQKSFTLKDAAKVPAENGQVQKSFGQFLVDSLGQVNELQHEANFAIENLASGNSKNLHETMLKVEQADLAFRTMNQVRSKVIDAYKEIMKMQI